MTEFSPRQQPNEAERRGDDLDTYTIPAIGTDSTSETPESQYTTRETMRAIAEERDNSESTPLFTRGRIIAASVLAGTIFAGSAFFGGMIARGGDSEKTEPRSEPGVSAPATPGQSASPSETSVESQFSTKEQDPSSVIESDLYKALTPEKQAEIKTYNDMPLAQFLQLPAEQRLVYAQFYHDVYNKYAVEQIKKKTATRDNYIPAPEMSPSSSGQEILNDFVEKKATAVWSIAANGDPYKLRDAQKENAKKALALIYYAPESGEMVRGNPYDRAAQNIDLKTSLVPDSSNPNNSDQYIIRTAMETSPLLEGIHSQTGEPSRYIHVLLNGETTQYFAICRTFKDINDQTRYAWQVDSIVSQNDMLYIPNLSTVH